MKKKKLALFDFDGTITRKDSFLEFLLFSHGYFRLFLGGWLLLPVLILYFLKIHSNETAKRIVMKYFYKNWTIERWQEATKKFTDLVIPKIVKKSALTRIQWHREQEHELFLVSASVEYWLAGFCQQNRMGVIGTKLEMKEGKFTGNFLTPNCYGIEKVKRIQEVVNLDDYDYIYAYGDTRGDREMLAMADEAFYRHFQ